MKKTFIILGLSLLVAACGGNKEDNGSTSDSTSATSHIGTEKTAGTPTAAGAQLIAKADCGTCHKEQEKLIGPAFGDIAKKYPSSPATIDTLANKIVKGGSGNWGTVPMASHPAISFDDARTMVKYILTLKK